MTKKEILDTMQKCLDEMRQAESEQEGWVCKHCGKSTFETDYDYLANVDEHLGCALEKEQQAQKEIRKQEGDLEFGEVATLKVPEIKHPNWLV